MASKGKTISNKVTGEGITWLETAQDTGGKYLSLRFRVSPSGYLPVRHLHPQQTETFEITKGSLKLELNGETHTLRPGDKALIPMGAPHQWWNASSMEPLEALVRFEPALNTEVFLEQYFGLCNSGKTKPDGTPHFLQIMTMMNAYQLFIAGPPVPVQKAMGLVLGGIGRLLGYKAYDPAY